MGKTLGRKGWPIRPRALREKQKMLTLFIIIKK